MSVSPLWDVAHMRRHAKESSADSLQRRYSKMVSAKSLSVHYHDACTAMHADVHSIHQSALPICMYLVQNRIHTIMTHSLFAYRFKFSSPVQHTIACRICDSTATSTSKPNQVESPLCKVQVLQQHTCAFLQVSDGGSPAHSSTDRSLLGADLCGQEAGACHCSA